MMENRKDLIRELSAYHSAEKALEIAIDYERGDDYARQWVATLRLTFRTPTEARP